MNNYFPGKGFFELGLQLLSEELVNRQEAPSPAPAAPAPMPEGVVVAKPIEKDSDLIILELRKKITMMEKQIDELIKENIFLKNSK